MENKNTFPFKTSIKINKEPIDIMPGPGDEIIICGSKEMAIMAALEYNDGAEIVEAYCTEDGDYNAVLCKPFTFSGEKFGFVGIMTEMFPSKASLEKRSSRIFYAYKTN